MQTIVGLFIVLVIILSMGLQFSSKEGFEDNTGKPKTATPTTATPMTATPTTATPSSKESFTSMAQMNMFDGMPAYY
jgi:hypothetical protein